MKRKILIIGGGITGLTTAYELSKHNIDITVVDNHPLGKGSASWAGAGIISPLYPWKYDDTANTLSIQSQALYPEFAHTLKEVSGIDPEYARSGLLMKDEYDSIEAKKWLSAWNVSYTPTDEGALFDVAHIRNNKLLKSLKKYLEIKGITFINTTINNLSFHKDVVIGADEFRADNVVLCAGSWTNEILPTHTPVAPVKGEMITIFDSKKSIPHIVLSEGKYIVPRVDGTVLIGSTMEHVGFNADLHHKEELFAFLVQHYPQFAHNSITHHWCGFRPGAEYIMTYKHETYQHLYINTGHYRNGINTSPQSAKILSQLILSS